MVYEAHVRHSFRSGTNDAETIPEAEVRLPKGARDDATSQDEPESTHPGCFDELVVESVSQFSTIYSHHAWHDFEYFH